jgi:hypothetical protein
MKWQVGDTAICVPISVHHGNFRLTTFQSEKQWLKQKPAGSASVFARLVSPLQCCYSWYPWFGTRSGFCFNSISPDTKTNITNLLDTAKLVRNAYRISVRTPEGKRSLWRYERIILKLFLWLTKHHTMKTKKGWRYHLMLIYLVTRSKWLKLASSSGSFTLEA